MQLINASNPRLSQHVCACARVAKRVITKIIISRAGAGQIAISTWINTCHARAIRFAKYFAIYFRNHTFFSAAFFQKEIFSVVAFSIRGIIRWGIFQHAIFGNSLLIKYYYCSNHSKWHLWRLLSYTWQWRISSRNQREWRGFGWRTTKFLDRFLVAISRLLNDCESGKIALSSAQVGNIKIFNPSSTELVSIRAIQIVEKIMTLE